MDVRVEELDGDRWEASIAVTTPAGPRYFREWGPNRTAALLTLRQKLRPYQGDDYEAARAAVLERAIV